MQSRYTETTHRLLYNLTLLSYTKTVDVSVKERNKSYGSIREEQGLEDRSLILNPQSPLSGSIDSV